MAKYSFRDPTTHVLKAWGYMETNAPGDLSRTEPDDFALTPGEWQWNGFDWIAFAPTATPEVTGFIMALRAEMGLTLSNTLLAAYPAAFQALPLAQWQDFEDMVVQAHTDTAIDDTLYNTIGTLAGTYAIPISLPAL